MLRPTLTAKQNASPIKNTTQVNSSTVTADDESGMFSVDPTCDLAQGEWSDGLKINLREVVFEFENLINLEEVNKISSLEQHVDTPRSLCTANFWERSQLQIS